MINKENSSFYLRYLIKKTESRPISYEQIPKQFQDYFSIPALSQSLNISLKYPKINWEHVEYFFDSYKFHTYEDLIDAIKETFETIMDKLYAVYYYTATTIEYDIPRSLEKDKKEMTIEAIFKKQKGICSDYAIFFIQLAKQVGITSMIMKIVKMGNYAKTKNNFKFDSPENPDYSHACMRSNMGSRLYK